MVITCRAASIRYIAKYRWPFWTWPLSMWKVLPYFLKGVPMSSLEPSTWHSICGRYEIFERSNGPWIIAHACVNDVYPIPLCQGKRAASVMMRFVQNKPSWYLVWWQSVVNIIILCVPQGSWSHAVYKSDTLHRPNHCHSSVVRWMQQVLCEKNFWKAHFEPFTIPLSVYM